MCFAGDTIYKFFRVILVIAAIVFCALLVRCGMYDATVDYVRALAAWLIGAVSYGIMWVAREFY